MNRILVWMAAGLVLTGCKMQPMGPYISPRITGRVVAAGSGEDLTGVKVIRGQVRRSLTSQAKGGELMVSKIPAMTDRNGRFTLSSQRVLSVFRSSEWDQAWLTFEHPGYETLTTNYATLGATNTPQGEPILDIGIIRLERTGR
ncbi:MAG: hypothetical protein ACREIC_17815 [Limisphaerales bacterium]